MTELDAGKLLNAEVMRSNLLLSSLYLSAYEILKATIVEGVKQVIVHRPKPVAIEDFTRYDERRESELQRIHDADILAYERLIEDYEKELGVQFDQRDRYGLIPSCNWLKSEDILSDEDIENVRTVREHRNQIAHELPTLLSSRGFNVDLSFLKKIIEILKKVEPFFARVDADIPSNVPDESIMSGGQLVLGLVWDAVTEHLEEINIES